ncbi:glycosyltransferase family 4 protein [Nocardioides montaniterrae]
MTLYVDPRHTGHFGIARYAAEVLPRLGLGERPLELHLDAMSPRAYLEKGWRRPSAADLIYSPAFWTGRSVARQVLTVHDLIYLHARGRDAALQRLYLERLVKPALRRSGHVFTVSESSADDLRSWLGPTVTVHVTGNACSPVFTPAGPAYESSRRYVLYVGNAKAHKNLALLAGAMARMPDRDLVVVSGEADVVARTMSAHGVADRTTILSGLGDAELAACYRGAEVLAMPSTVEGFGLPALEAICSGTPVAHLGSCRAVAEVVGRDGAASDSATGAEEYADAIRRAAGLGRVARDRPDWAHVADRVRAGLVLIAPDLVGNDVD